jgi:hypothetical protein
MDGGFRAPRRPLHRLHLRKLSKEVRMDLQVTTVIMFGGEAVVDEVVAMDVEAIDV